VVHLGHSLSVDEGAAALPPASLPGGPQPFILYVGDRQAYKNFAGFIQAYARSPRLRRQFRVVAFGGRPLTHAEQRLLTDLAIAQRVLQVSGSDELLAAHYRAAQLFVCPSRYEGFGLPPLEAMAHGCPVACSHGGSLAEVVGEAGELFDPENLDSIVAALERVAYDDGRRADLIARGHAQAAQFSWPRCATQTSEVYRQLT
jgi:glycosyltransferase involved in cell wall biosynthesis